MYIAILIWRIRHTDLRLVAGGTFPQASLAFAVLIFSGGFIQQAWTTAALPYVIFLNGICEHCIRVAFFFASCFFLFLFTFASVHEQFKIPSFVVCVYDHARRFWGLQTMRCSCHGLAMFRLWHREVVELVSQARFRPPFRCCVASCVYKRPLSGRTGVLRLVDVTLLVHISFRDSSCEGLATCTLFEVSTAA